MWGEFAGLSEEVRDEFEASLKFTKLDADDTNLCEQEFTNFGETGKAIRLELSAAVIWNELKVASTKPGSSTECYVAIFEGTKCASAGGVCVQTA